MAVTQSSTALNTMSATELSTKSATGLSTKSATELSTKSATGLSTKSTLSTKSAKSGKDSKSAKGSSVVSTTNGGPSNQEEVDKMLINVKGLRHTVYSINGDEYTGGWKGFKKHGKGTFKWKASGEIYEGNWEDNKRCGFGTLIVPKEGGSYRMEYSGEWVKDRKHGQGSHFYSEHEFYEGQWKKGTRSGWGVMTFADGNIFEGEWGEDKQKGHGVLKLTNGNRYEGEWSNGQKHGSGKFYYEDKGQVYDGVWQDGVPRCGEMQNYDRTAPAAPPYVMPEIGLLTPLTVLEKARDEFVTPPADEPGKKMVAK